MSIRPKIEAALTATIEASSDNLARRDANEDVRLAVRDELAALLGG